ncbi:MAG: PorT family protein [Crocinitomicaceae bacterium]|nr:PorT family protein [Crocinitomicaceae bacterium]
MKSLITLLIITISIKASAQDLFVGPEIGINLVKIETQQIGNDYQPGIFGGATVEYNFNKALSLRTGVYYSQGRQQTSELDTTELNLFGLIDPSSIPGVDLNTYSETTNRYTQHYLQIPIMVNYSFKNLNIFGGGYLGVKVADKRKSKTVSTTPFMSTIDLGSIDPTGFVSSFLPAANESTFDESSDNSNLNTLDYGIKAGIGYELKNFNINASYQFGIPDFRTDRGENDLQRHQFFQLSISYLMGLNFNSSKSRIR